MPITRPLTPAAPGWELTRRPSLSRSVRPRERRASKYETVPIAKARLSVRLCHSDLSSRQASSSQRCRPLRVAASAAPGPDGIAAPPITGACNCHAEPAEQRTSRTHAAKTKPAAHTATRLGRDAHPKWVMFVSRLRKYGGDHDHITPAAGGRNHLRKRSTGSGRTRSTRRSRAASDSAAPEGGQVWK